MIEISQNDIADKNTSNQEEMSFFDENVAYSEQVDKKRKNTELEVNILSKPVATPLWLSISEAAKIGGVQNKTVRRAIQAKQIKYKIIGNRYLVDFASFVQYLFSSTKLKNKLNQGGIGQYIDIWRD